MVMDADGPKYVLSMPSINRDGMMTTTDASALSRSDLNDFLFADVGTEASGMPLSVLSVLARLGMDPWQEAGRLAKLPRQAAVDGLAGIIAAMPASLWSLQEATAIAARLVALLPAGGRAAGGGLATPRTNKKWAIVLALTAAVATGLAFNLTGYLGKATDSNTGGRAAAIGPAAPASPSAAHTRAGE
jgi:hypothetical protein